MRKIVKITLFIALTWFFVGCEVDPDDVSVDNRFRLEGNWLYKEESLAKVSRAYYGTIAIDNETGDGVLISNFYGLGSDVVIKASTRGRVLNIPAQSFGNNFNLLEGSGDISDDYEEIILFYRVDDGSGIADEVNATWVKQ